MNKLLTLSSLLIPAALVAQTQPPRGLASQWPLGFLADGYDEIVYRPSGIDGQLGFFNQTYSEANWVRQEILDAISQAYPSASGIQLELDAISSGNDLTPVVWVTTNPQTGAGHFQIEPTYASAWMGLYFTVAEGSMPPVGDAMGYQLLNQGGWIDELAQQQLPYGGEIIGWYPEQLLIPTSYENQQFLERTASEFVPGTVPLHDIDIVGLDFAMGLIQEGAQVSDPGIRTDSMLCFSVTASSAASITSVCQLATTPGPLGASVSGATVFVMQWLNGAVTIHTIAPTELGLDPAADDIDMLMVGFSTVTPASVTGAGKTMPPDWSYVDDFTIFSLAPGSVSHNGPADELLMNGGVQGVTRKEPLKGPGGINILSGAKIFGGNIVGGCTHDPEGGWLERCVGSPMNIPGAGPLGLSVCRDVAHRRKLRATLSGWGSAPAPNAVFFGLDSSAVPVAPLTPASSWQFVHVGFRDSTKDYFEFALPDSRSAVPLNVSMFEFELGTGVLRSTIVMKIADF